MTRPLPKYVATFNEPDGRPLAMPLDFTDTRIRRAIRRAKKILKQYPLTGRRVSISGQQPASVEDMRAGINHHPWRVEYQAHIGADGKIHVEER